MSEPMTEAQLAEMERTAHHLAHWENRAAAWDAGAQHVLESDAPALVAEVRRLRGILQAYGLPLALSPAVARVPGAVSLGGTRALHAARSKLRGSAWAQGHRFGNLRREGAQWQATCYRCQAVALLGQTADGGYWMDGAAVHDTCLANEQSARRVLYAVREVLAPVGPYFWDPVTAPDRFQKALALLEAAVEADIGGGAPSDALDDSCEGLDG